MVRIGDLNKRLTLQRATQVPDGMGGFTPTWRDVATVWGALWPVSAKEQVAAGQTRLEITHRIRIRYRSDVTAACRVRYGTRHFAIVSLINPSEAGRVLDLLCLEAA